MSTNERFTAEESAALLHWIFPRYPDLDGMNPVPEIGAFLLTLRSRKDAPVSPVRLPPTASGASLPPSDG